MAVLSLQFLLLVTVTAVLYRLASGRKARPVRVGLVTIANLAFLASFVPATGTLAAKAAWFLPLLGFLALGGGAIVVVGRRPSRAVLGTCVVVLVAAFVVLKQYSFVRTLAPLPHAFLTVGLSYVLFRVLQLVIDTATEGRTPGLGPLRFFNFCCFFLSFLSGPIQRFEDWAREEERTDAGPITGDILLASGTRATRGILKTLFAAPLAMWAHQQALAALQGKPGAHLHLPAPASVALAAASIAYLLFLYWNFSGYMDVVIAGGLLMGFTVPENFADPFRAPNFIDLWSRWHITLSDWFRFYLFNPIVTALTRVRTSARLAPYYGVVGFLVTFFVMGVWHGTTSVFFVYGLVLGGGVAVNKLYQVRLRAMLGKARYQALVGNPAYRRAANGLMLGFYAIALSCFWLEWPALVTLVRAVGALGIAGALLVGSVASACVVLGFDGVAWIAARLHVDRAFGSPRVQTAARAAFVAIGIVAVVLRSAIGHSQAPAFVYAEF